MLIYSRTARRRRGGAAKKEKSGSEWRRQKFPREGGKEAVSFWLRFCHHRITLYSAKVASPRIGSLLSFFLCATSSSKFVISTVDGIDGRMGKMKRAIDSRAERNYTIKSNGLIVVFTLNRASRLWEWTYRTSARQMCERDEKEVKKIC